jgi:hypothetical protein
MEEIWRYWVWLEGAGRIDGVFVLFPFGGWRLIFGFSARLVFILLFGSLSFPRVSGY